MCCFLSIFCGKKGGVAFLKEWEKCKRPWPEFSLFLNQFHTVCPKIETEFLGKLGNLNVFSAQEQVVSKKKGLHRNWDWFFGQNRKFKRFFCPRSGGLQKQSGLHQNWDWFLGQNRKFKHFFIPNHDIYFTTSAPNFLWGGAVFNFSQKIGLKSTKNVRFCILHKPMGGLEPTPPPPTPPLATLLLVIELVMQFFSLIFQNSFISHGRDHMLCYHELLIALMLRKYTQYKCKTV